MVAMDIDLNVLPIPDWGIECPRCGYALVGLPSHRCPECGARFEMADVVKPWHRLREPRFTGCELPLPDFGLLCQSCGRALAGARGRECPDCGAPFDPEVFRPRREWFIVDQAMCGEVSLAGLEPLLAAEYVPHMRAQGKLLTEICGIANVAGSRLTLSSEFYFELLWLLRKSTKEIEQVRQDPGQPWTCRGCGEEVPGHFNVCWNCERPRAAP